MKRHPITEADASAMGIEGGQSRSADHLRRDADVLKWLLSAVLIGLALLAAWSMIREVVP